MPAIRKLLSNYLPNIFDIGASTASNNNDINLPSFATRSAPSLYHASIWSGDVNRNRTKTRFTGDGDRRLEADEVSLVSRERW